MMPGTLVVICGPTAIGKTELSIQLAKELGTEIISADSRQFYREMNIGTAKPSPAQLSAVKHHLIGHLSIQDTYNVSMFEQDALYILKEIFRTKSHAILCGGSGLYIDALCRGIDDLPDADTEIRKKLQDQLDNEGIESLQKELQILDPEYYAEVDRNNPKRLMRAIEVCRIAGKKYSDLRKSQPKSREFNIIKIGLNTDREKLFDRINRRTERMIEKGLLKEVMGLRPYKNENALNTVGYKEIFNYLDGSTELAHAIEKIKTNTRRYAKRQLTWFKKDPSIQWFEPGQFYTILEFIHKKS